MLPGPRHHRMRQLFSTETAPAHTIAEINRVPIQTRQQFRKADPQSLLPATFVSHSLWLAAAPHVHRDYSWRYPTLDHLFRRDCLVNDSDFLDAVRFLRMARPSCALYLAPVPMELRLVMASDTMPF